MRALIRIAVSAGLVFGGLFVLIVVGMRLQREYADARDGAAVAERLRAERVLAIPAPVAAPPEPAYAPPPRPALPRRPSSSEVARSPERTAPSGVGAHR